MRQFASRRTVVNYQRDHPGPMDLQWRPDPRLALCGNIVGESGRQQQERTVHHAVRCQCENGTYLTLWACDSNEISQRWGTDNNGSLDNLHTGKYMTPYGGGSRSGTTLTVELHRQRLPAMVRQLTKSLGMGLARLSDGAM